MTGRFYRPRSPKLLLFLTAGARQEAIDHIKQYQDLAARSDAGCYIFGLIYFNADDLRHALTWFDRALALRPAFLEALSARAIVLQRVGLTFP